MGNSCSGSYCCPNNQICSLLYLGWELLLSSSCALVCACVGRRMRPQKHAFSASRRGVRDAATSWSIFYEKLGSPMLSDTRKRQLWTWTLAFNFKGHQLWLWCPIQMTKGLKTSIHHWKVCKDLAGNTAGGRSAPPRKKSETLPDCPSLSCSNSDSQIWVFVLASCWFLKQSKPMTWNVIKGKELCSLPHPICILHTKS